MIAAIALRPVGSTKKSKQQNEVSIRREADYRDCHKNVPFHRRFLLQSLMLPFLISEHKYEKRYKIKSQCSLFLCGIGLLSSS